MKNGNKNLIVFSLIFAAALGGLIYWQMQNNTAPGNQKAEVASTVPYLLPNLPLKQHIHPELKIFVDSAEEALPAEIGLTLTQHRAIHTHETDGVIHIEAQDTREYTLGNFFSVWGRTIAREGYDVEMLVDDKTNTEYENLILRDGQKIVLKYTRIK